MPKFDFVGGLLTDEETDVLQLRRRGWRNADIAAELNCSERTVNRARLLAFQTNSHDFSQALY